MIALLNRIMTAGVDAAMRPFQAASPWVALIVVSVVLALVGLLVFRFCSNQASVRRLRNRTIACLLEFRLFQDDPLGVFATLGRTLVAGGGYMAQMIRPVAVMFVPFTLLFVQLSGWFEYRPLREGERSLLTVELLEGADRDGATVAASDGLRIETAGFVAPTADEIVWRFAALREGQTEWLETVVGSERQRKGVAVSHRFERVELARVAGPFWTRLAHPCEAALPGDGAFRAIRVDYPRREIACFGREVHWVAALLVLTIGFGFLLRVPLRVEF